MLRKLLYSFIILGLITGCTKFKAEPIEPADEKKGPGLFSGSDGEFRVPLPESWNSKKEPPLKRKRLTL